ncbi:MAG: hypothetical protein Q4E76_06510 [Tissierellia bacterium]|nr:hypothetical protein [Tissierellia bacterium]
MKKNLKTVALAVTALSVFVACQNQPAENNQGAENAANNAAVTENVVENNAAGAETTEVAAGEIAHIGMGFDGSIKGTDAEGEKPATASGGGYAGLVAFDSEGKIVAAKFDVIQPSITLDEAGVPGTFEEIESKNVLGDAYGMKKASEIGKEWYEQAEAFADYITGKTVDEVKNIPTKVKDEKHQNVADTPDLASSVTIDIGSFQSLVEEAYATKAEAAGATYIGLDLAASDRSKAEEGKPTKVGFNIYATGVAVDQEGKIVQTLIDVVQPSIEFADGAFADAEEVQTKNELGDAYGMKKASEIGLEWYEQADNFEAYTIGKTAEEVVAIPTKMRDESHMNVADTPDLSSTVSIDIGDFQNNVVAAVENAHS